MKWVALATLIRGPAVTMIFAPTTSVTLGLFGFRLKQRA